MPLFHKSPTPDTERKKGVLSRNSRTKDTTSNDHNSPAISSSPERKTRKGIFTNRNRRTSSSSTSPSESESQRQSNSKTTSSPSRRSGSKLFGNRLRNNKSRSIDHDPSIIAARQKVSDAEQAEKDADRALNEARNHVQLARDHILTLEREAIEEWVEFLSYLSSLNS